MRRLPIDDPSHIAASRREAAVLAASVGFDETDAGRLAIVVTELANNVLRHGGGGALLIGADPMVEHGVQVLALDRGAGMANIAACMRDGYSTAGTPGTGLGAVQRQSDTFMIHSRLGAGTAVLVRLASRRAARLDVTRTHAILSVPHPAETVCGDSGAVVTGADGCVGILVADGLGHGPIAAAASHEAVRLFQKLPLGPPVPALRALHAGLRATRGAAIAVALIEPGKQSVLYGGIGNIAGLITGDTGVRRMVSHAGIAGHNAGTPRELSYPLGEHPVVVMYSDGLSTSWAPETYAGLWQQDPLLLAGVLYRDQARRRDDAIVVVWKG